MQKPTLDILNQAETDSRGATPAPWFAKATDDEQYMNARYVSTDPGPFEHDNKTSLDAHDPDLDVVKSCVAITLLQAPSLAIHDAGCWDEDAQFIATARTAVPVLLGIVREALDWSNVSDPQPLLEQWFQNAMKRRDVKAMLKGGAALLSEIPEDEE